MTPVRVGIADHLGWAVVVTASVSHEVMDRRRIELVEPGLSKAPIHYDGKRLDVVATTALVARVRASVARATSAAFDQIEAAASASIASVSLRSWPADFPAEIAVQRRVPYEARADAIMYRQVLADLARDRGWGVQRLLPEPRWTVGGRPAWAWSTIAAWARDTGRLPSRG